MTLAPTQRSGNLWLRGAMALKDALHRSAQDQQILVLTCRQSAFAALGGEKAVAQIDAA